MSLKTEGKDTSLAQRYYHICVDKLADAFEKQFMMGLPDFGLYTKIDQQLSPKSLQAKLDKFGLHPKKHIAVEDVDATNTPFMQAQMEQD